MRRTKAPSKFADFIDNMFISIAPKIIDKKVPRAETKAITKLLRKPILTFAYECSFSLIVVKRNMFQARPLHYFLLLSHTYSFYNALAYY